MKKYMCLLLACLTLLLTSCSKSDEPVAEPTQSPTPAPTETPVPTPSPTPVPVVDIADYQYFIVNNSTLAVSFKYPSHWINTPGKSTICYVEPVNPGETAARLAVSSKVVSERPTDKELKAELTDFLALVEASFPGYEAGEQKDDVSIMETNGVRQKYTAHDSETGESITGYVLICYVRNSRRIYLLHFTAPTGEYDQLSAVVDVIRESMSTT